MDNYSIKNERILKCIGFIKKIKKASKVKIGLTIIAIIIILVGIVHLSILGGCNKSYYCSDGTQLYLLTGAFWIVCGFVIIGSLIVYILIDFLDKHNRSFHQMMDKLRSLTGQKTDELS
jgi:hypothetical protein